MRRKPWSHPASERPSSIDDRLPMCLLESYGVLKPWEKVPIQSSATFSKSSATAPLRIVRVELTCYHCCFLQPNCTHHLDFRSACRSSHATDISESVRSLLRRYLLCAVGEAR